MGDSEQQHTSGSTSPQIADEESKVRRRRSTLGARRSCRSVGGRLSLAAPPAPTLQDQLLRVEEWRPWDSKLNQVLDIALREAVRRLESRLPGDECVPELRAAILTQAGSVAGQLSEKLCDLTPAGTAVTGHNTPIASGSIEVYKQKSKALEQEYIKWRTMRKQREAECRAAEIEFQEAKSGVTTMDGGQEVHLSPAQRDLINSWMDCSLYVEEAQQAREKAHLVLEEVRHTAEVVNGFLTVSRLQADSSYTALENLSNAHLKTEPLTLLMKNLMHLHSTCLPGDEAAQPLV